MSVAKGMGPMATETEHHDTLDDGIEIVLDKPGADDGMEIVVRERGAGGDRTVVVDETDVVETRADIDAGAPAPVEVVVVDDAYITAEHADAQQVFAAAARLRPVFTALSVAMMICVALAVYGVSVLLPA